jgi:adenosylmethionine-8-amino-7-oxononanoate aminotransferase
MENKQNSAIKNTRPSVGGAQDLFYSYSDEFPRPTIIKGVGVFVWDDQGNSYLDASSGPVTCNIGHRNRRVLNAMSEQAEKLCFSFASTARNQPNLVLSKQLTELAGKGFERALFVSGGSLAVDMAIKFCRQYRYAKGETKRHKLISCQPSYHGMTLGCLAVGGDSSFNDVFSDMINVSTKIKSMMNYRFAEGKSEHDYALQCAQDLETKIIELGEESVLAFIVEPVGGSSSGAISPPEIYFKEVRRICDKYSVFLIYDEVMSGVGRTGTFLTHHQWSDAQPDIVVLAKGLGAGYTPLGAMLTSATLVDELASLTGFNYAHTYNANPLACAVGSAVLSEIAENNLLKNVLNIGQYLQEQLIKLQSESLTIGDVRGKGLLLAIEFVACKASKAQIPLAYQATEKFKQFAFKQGLLIYGRRSNNGQYGEHVMITPPLNINRKESDLLIKRLSLTIYDFERWLKKNNVL